MLTQQFDNKDNCELEKSIAKELKNTNLDVVQQAVVRAVQKELVWRARPSPPLLFIMLSFYCRGGRV